MDEDNKFTLAFSKPVTGDWCDIAFQQAVHRAIRTRRQAIRRKLRRKITKTERSQLAAELQNLASMETQFFNVRHRETSLPLGEDGKPYVPTTARGKRHLPITALPLNARGRRHVPSARQIVGEAAFARFMEKGNDAMAVAKLAQTFGVEKEVLKETGIDPKIRRALSRVGSDVKAEWPPKADELLVLENFYATELLQRPLCGIAHDHAVWLLEKIGSEMTVDRYRRILRKFRLA